MGSRLRLLTLSRHIVAFSLRHWTSRQFNTIGMATAAAGRQRDSHLERTAKEPRGKELFDVQVGQIDQVNERIRLFRLDLQSGPVKFLAGQWLDTFVPGLPKPGGFTITSAPSAASHGPWPYLELAVQESPENPPAAWLWRPKDQILGSTLQVRVGGSFVFPPRGLDLKSGSLRRVVFVAGGVGVNPLMSMLSYLADDDGNIGRCGFEVCFLYASKLLGVGDIKDILFLDRITTLFGEGRLKGHVKLYVTGGNSVTEETQNINGAQVEVQSRRLSIDDLREVVGGEFRESSVVYVCGPPTMTDEFVEIMTAKDGLGIDSRRVLTEKWW